MKTIYLAGAALLLAACSAQEASSDAVTVDAGDAMDSHQDDLAMETAGDEEAMDGRSIDGRWGIQFEACMPENETGDGVILISQYDVIVGMDACSITGVTQDGDGYALETMCDSMEGDQYAQTYYFSTPQDGVMRWDNREMSRVEDYISCDGGAMH